MNSFSKTFKPGSVGIVTGGGSGLGRQLCFQLAKLGMIVAVTDINREDAEGTVKNIQQNGGKARSYVFDVSIRSACESFVNEVIANHGKIDLLIANAGKVVIGEFNEVPSESWHTIMDTNFFGQLNMSMAVYPHLRKLQEGRIVFISSVAGLVFQPLTGSYSASKHALVGLACSLYDDASQHGIKVHIACPGYIDNTAIFEKAESYGYSSLKIRDILAEKIKGFISPEKAAGKILKGIHCNRFFMVFPLNARLLWLLFRIVPETTVRYSHILKRLVSPARNIHSS
jgi:NAD(P)-dependent dehydrogenase (short-subunit alcohol dehydrogenase family)